jgi:hypothetical protein
MLAAETDLVNVTIPPDTPSPTPYYPSNPSYHYNNDDDAGEDDDDSAAIIGGIIGGVIGGPIVVFLVQPLSQLFVAVRAVILFRIDDLLFCLCLSTTYKPNRVHPYTVQDSAESFYLQPRILVVGFPCSPRPQL